MGGSLRIARAPIVGAFVVDNDAWTDSRGSFRRLFCADELSEILDGRRIVQINQSVSLGTGIVRGMHYQRSPHAEMKFVRCLSGRIWDVALDLRRESPTFLKWHAEELSAGNGRMFVIPEGVAHGFQTLDAHNELLYLHTAAYERSAEDSVRFDDPLAGISWPLAIGGISDKDRDSSLLPPDYRGIDL